MIIIVISPTMVYFNIWLISIIGISAIKVADIASLIVTVTPNSNRKGFVASRMSSADLK